MDMAERGARHLRERGQSNEWERKSAGEQETFERDTLDAGPRPGARPGARRGRCSSRLAGRRLPCGFRTVTVTVRFENFVTLTRSRTAEIPIVTQDTLEALAHDLLLPFFDERENPRRRKIRLIGVRAEKLLRESPAP